MSATAFETATAGRPLRIGLWAAQVVLAFVFISAGLVKLLTPIPQLAAMMPWAGQYSETFVRFIGLVDLAGGIGILLPALTRILPRLTVLAALGCTVLQAFALVFHISRGEAPVTPLNLVLLALSLFVLWGTRPQGTDHAASVLTGRTSHDPSQDPRQQMVPQGPARGDRDPHGRRRRRGQGGSSH